MRSVSGTGYRYKAVHVILAELALGKEIPVGAQVHHVDENRLNNAPSNLVICESKAYHHLLHLRRDALLATGDPHWRRCRRCKRWNSPSNLLVHPRKDSPVGDGEWICKGGCTRALVAPFKAPPHILRIDAPAATQ